MSQLAIRVEKVGKQYRIGQRERYKALRDTLTDVIYTPFRIATSLVRGHGLRNENSTSEQTIWALRDVSFEVQHGEILGIIGRNGAGKSTLLKILSRITEPTEGSVDIYGRVGSLLEVGTGFHPELTGRENIYLNGAILGMRKVEIERKFDEIVEFAEIVKFLDTPVKFYSSGMYMRLAFSVAAHLEPEILLVDEVLAVGDVAFQKKCLYKMGEVAKGGRTVLFVSHNMNAIEQLCQKCLLLVAGRIDVFNNDVRSVVTNYLFGKNGLNVSTEWINTGNEFTNEYFKPLRFYIADDKGNHINRPVGNDEDVWIFIQAEILKLDTALTIGYALYTEENQLLYWTYQTDDNDGNWPIISDGICLLKSRFPKRLFNEGLYRLELIGGLHFREWFFKPGHNVPTISITIQGGLSDSPYWMTRRPGLLAPVLRWFLEENKKVIR